jgi:hypothetical protein
MIHGAGRVGADLDSPRGRPALVEGCAGHVLDPFAQFTRVAVDVLLVLGRNRLTEDQAQDPADGRSTVGVSRADDKSLADDAGLLLEPMCHFIGQVSRDAAVLDGDQDERAVLGGFRLLADVAADRQGTSLDPLLTPSVSVLRLP